MFGWAPVPAFLIAVSEGDVWPLLSLPHITHWRTGDDWEHGFLALRFLQLPEGFVDPEQQAHDVSFIMATASRFICEPWRWVGHLYLPFLTAVSDVDDSEPVTTAAAPPRCFVVRTTITLAGQLGCASQLFTIFDVLHALFAGGPAPVVCTAPACRLG
jgi:hypothetical protein